LNLKVPYSRMRPWLKLLWSALPMNLGEKS